VTVLENRRRDLADFLGFTERVKMIPNGVPLLDMARRAAWRAETRRSLGIDEESLVFIAVGRMVPQKRPLHFLEKAAQFQAAFPEARFLWVGDGILADEWDRWVAERKMGAIIRRIPWQTDVQPFLCAADIFFHVAEFEGLPLAILEALSAGLPCALSSHLLAEMPFLTPGNSISIEENGTVPRIFGDQPSLEQIGRAGRELAEREFSYGTMAARYESAYLGLR
jgi:glycosyltransferase involved in cell wall biosynthesis